MAVHHIPASELEQIAHRVWYAKWPKAQRVNGGEEKHASFESMGYVGRSTEFPMRSGEWTRAGAYDVSITYPHLDVPGVIRARKTSVYKYKLHETVCLIGGSSPCKIVKRLLEDNLPMYHVRMVVNGNVLHLREWEIEPPNPIRIPG